MKTGNIIVSALIFAITAVGLSAAESWITSIDDAKKQAAEENKTILIDFTGSDWCGWCIKLNDEVFSKESFQEYAKENLVLVEIDLPRGDKLTDAEKAANRKIVEKYKVSGFPTIVLLNKDGKEIARTGYKRGGPDKYVTHLEEIIAKAAGS